MQRQRRHGGHAGARGEFMPRLGTRIVQKIVAPDRPVFADRDGGGILAARIVGIHGNARLCQIGSVFTKGSGWHHQPTRFIDQADPRHFQAAETHRIAADLREQGVLTAAAHDGLVTLAEGFVESGKARECEFRALALGDVLDEKNPGQRIMRDDRAAKQYRYARTVFAEILLLERRANSPVSEFLQSLGIDLRPLEWCHGAPVESACGEIVAGAADHAQEAVVGVRNPVALAEDDADQIRLEQACHARLAFTLSRQRLFCASAGGDGVFHQVQCRESSLALGFQSFGLDAGQLHFDFLGVCLGLLVRGKVQEAGQNVLLAVNQYYVRRIESHHQVAGLDAEL